MKKLYYLLSCSMLCSFNVAFAQENFPKPAFPTQPAALSEEQFPRPLSASNNEEESFMLFSDDILQDENSNDDEELKAKSLLDDDIVAETQNFPKPRDPLPVQTPQNIAPNIKEDPAQNKIELNLPQNNNNEVLQKKQSETPHVVIPLSDIASDVSQKSQQKDDAINEKPIEVQKTTEALPKVQEPITNVVDKTENVPTSAPKPEVDTKQIPEQNTQPSTLPVPQKDMQESFSKPAEKSSEPQAMPAPLKEDIDNSPKKKETQSFDLPNNLQEQISSSPKGPYSLSKDAPLPSNLLGDSGFAPSLLNKTIEISPEQRVKMMMKRKYDEMDANHDGMVSEEEFVKYKTAEAQKIAKQIFKKVDRNGNGLLSGYEYEILMNKMIDSYIKQPRPNK